jgi:hypothetical protein
MLLFGVPGLREDKCLRCGNRTRDTALCQLCVKEIKAERESGDYKSGVLSEIVYVGPYTLVRL